VRFGFGEYVLDIERRELRRDGALVEIEPQVHDLLAYLVEHSDHVVSKDDLLEAIWAGRIVSDSALTTRINAVRRVLGDDGATQRLIRTLPRRGWRFVGEVREIREAATDETTIDGLTIWAGGKAATLAVVFTDLVEYMRLLELFGDAEMDRIMQVHFAESRKHIQANGGREIKTLGDGVLAVFHTVEAAFDYAWAIHVAPGDRNLKVRVGIHIGTVLIKEPEISGTAVAVAGLITRQIKDAEIWLSDEAHDLLLASRLPRHAHFVWLKHEDVGLGNLQTKYALWSLANKISV
jgi:DNA-binding winged helix-turn-helix (wHTH) protein